MDQILNCKRLANVTPTKFKDKPIANITLCGNDFTLLKINVFPFHNLFAAINFNE